MFAIMMRNPLTGKDGYCTGRYFQFNEVMAQSKKEVRLFPSVKAASVYVETYLMPSQRAVVIAAKDIDDKILRA